MSICVGLRRALQVPCSEARSSWPSCADQASTAGPWRAWDPSRMWASVAGEIRSSQEVKSMEHIGHSEIWEAEVVGGLRAAQ